MERFLDVSQLEPPEPLEHILAATRDINDGEHLHVLHWREPFPLYPLLDVQGLEHHTWHDRDGMIHLYIWNPQDTRTDQQIRELISSNAG